MYKFLESFPNTILAVIAPNGKGDNKIQHNITIDEAFELNELRKKGDIYFTPNGDYKLFFGDQKKFTGRTISNAKNIYAFVVDIDSKEELWKNYDGLDKPTWVIETGHGHHLYYVLEKPLLYEDFQKEFKDIEQKLVILMKGDPKCTDISRVLRVPGFKYWKDNKGEIEISIKEDNKTLFDHKDISNTISKYYVSAGRDSEERKIITKKIKDRTLSKTFDEFFDAVARIDVADVLGDLYGSYYDIKSGGAIYEGGKRTDGYKYCKRGNYLNTFSLNDRPVGGPFSVAKFYYKNVSDTIEYFTKKWNIEFKRFDEIKKQFVGDVLVEMEKPNQNKEIRKSVRYGGAATGIIIDYENERIIQYYDKGESEYVNGIVESYGWYQHNDVKKYIIKTTKSGASEIRTLPLIGGGSDLRKFLMGMGLIVGESKSGLIYLLKYLTSIKTQYFYTECLGLQEINGKMVTVKKGGVYIDEPNNLFVNIPEISGEFITEGNGETTIKQFVEQLGKGYSLDISLPVLLTGIIGINAWYFRQGKHKTPQLFLSGLSGTGKTTLMELLYGRGLGLSLEFSSSAKGFSYEKFAKHYMPIRFTEYRNVTSNQVVVEGFIRTLFDGTPIPKGKSDQTIIMYPSNALYCFDGQATFTDDAAMTRLYYLEANPINIGDEMELRTLPNIYKQVANIFSEKGVFEKFMSLSRAYRVEIKNNKSLARDSNRLALNYGYLYALLDILGLPEYKEHITNALISQTRYLASDDIKKTYQKAFNLQQMNKFSMYVYKKGIVIDIIPEYLRMNTSDVNDLSGFIKTVNRHFLRNECSFIGMEVYVDCQYIFNNRDLWNQFIRSIRWLVPEGDYTDEERKTIRGIREFVATNFPNSESLSEWNFTANVLDGKHKKESQEPLAF